jgi:transcriptional regulator with XRE-family HTH domain
VGMLAEQFGREVRMRRKALGLSQAALAEAAMSEDWVRRPERGTGAPLLRGSRGPRTRSGRVFARLVHSDINARCRSHSDRRAPLRLIDAELKGIKEVVQAALKRPSC